MKRLLPLALAAAMLAAPAIAQAPPPAEERGLPMSALVNLPATGGAKLTVSSPAFKAGGDIPFENTQYQGNKFPGLEWSKGPAATKSYAIIMQDTDGIRNNMPILHWTMFNIPAGTTKLDAGMSTPPAGSAYGPNIRAAAQPYMGPRTPAGPKHRYHFQVFALDTTVDASKTYDEILAAMKGHVLASGEVIGLGQVDPSAPPRPPAPATPATPPAN
ncbi:MAG TPA: YbhB/YbcL family Raf kinase inhibitor-like protein [Hyphomonadaceae bacterium]|nr:YbhB/YbcL family Raf kinase inhibitor-like protein [Hyphomonadaceae bacterium]